MTAHSAHIARHAAQGWSDMVECWCGRVHQSRERAVPCVECLRPTLDVHGRCERHRPPLCPCRR